MHNPYTSYALISAFAILTACAQIASEIEPAFDVIPDTNGLAITPSGLRIDFGRAPEGVISLLDGNYGDHVALGTETCSAGIIQKYRWGNLTLTFTDEQFVGWQQNGAAQGRICAG